MHLLTGNLTKIIFGTWQGLRKKFCQELFFLANVHDSRGFSSRKIRQKAVAPQPPPCTWEEGRRGDEQFGELTSDSLPAAAAQVQKTLDQDTKQTRAN